MHTAPLLASTRFYPHFAMPWVRSTGFGSYSSDFRRFNTALLIACELVAFATASFLQVSLATQVHSLASYSKLTAQSRRTVSLDTYKVSGSFNSLSWVLFNFPSRYSFAIGLKTYLGLEVDASQFLAPFPRNNTLDTNTRILLGCHYGAITLYGASFQRTLRFQARNWCWSVTPHL